MGSLAGRWAKEAAGTGVPWPVPTSGQMPTLAGHVSGGRKVGMTLRGHRKHSGEGHWCSSSPPERAWLLVLDSPCPCGSSSAVLSTRPPASAAWGPLLSRVTASRWEMNSVKLLPLPGEAWSRSWGTWLLDSAPASLPGSPASSGLATPPGPSVPELTVILLLLPMAVSSRMHELMWTLWATSPSEEGPGLGVRISNEASVSPGVAKAEELPKGLQAAGPLVGVLLRFIMLSCPICTRLSIVFSKWMSWGPQAAAGEP